MRRLIRRRPVLIALALALLHVLFALLSFAPQPHTGGDNAAYISLGRSLLEHGSYTELWDPAMPAHTKYPPVFPAILAIALAVGLKPWVQLKLVVLGFSAGAVALSFLWMRARRRPLLALGIGLLLAIAPGVMREGRWVLSDVPFWAFTMLALWAFERLRADDWKRFAIAAVATLLAYFTRSAGLPLVLAAFAWLAWRRHWRQLGVLAVITAVPGLLWWLRGRAHGTGAYVSEFWLVNPYIPSLGRIGPVDFASRIAENAYKYATIHLPELLTARPGPFILLLSIAIFVTAVFAWIRRVRRVRRAGVADVFLPLYTGLIFVWPAIWSGERFLLPALALILLLAGEGVVVIARRLVPRGRFVLASAILTLVLLLTLPGLVSAIRIGRYCTGEYLAGDRYPCLGGRNWYEFFGLAELTAEVLPADAVVLSRKPRLYYVLSGLRGRNYPLSDDPEQFFATADSAGARYVALDYLDGVSDAYLLPVLKRRPAAFCLVGALEGGTALFGILPTWASAPDLGADAVETDDSGRFDRCGDEYWRSPEIRRESTRPGAR